MRKILIACSLAFTSLLASDAENPSLEPKINVNKPNFTTILLRRPDIFESIPRNQSVTIFAPTDEAFKNLKPSIRDNLMKPKNAEQLKKLMLNHVVPGEYYIKDLKDGMVLKSEDGKDLKITKQNGKIKINDANITESNGITERGVLHEIDKVLVPKDFNLKN